MNPERPVRSRPLGWSLYHVVTLDDRQHFSIGRASLREALDLTSPIGRAMYALVGVLAEVERAWIVERTLAGLRRARAQGKPLGRPPVALDLTRIQTLLAQGLSLREVARRTGASRATIARRLRPSDSTR